MAGISLQDKNYVMQLLLHTTHGESIATPPASLRPFESLGNEEFKRIAGEVNDNCAALFEGFFFAPAFIAKHEIDHPEIAYAAIGKVKISVSQLHHLAAPKAISRDTGAFGLICLYILRKQRLIRHSTAFRKLVEAAWLLGQQKSKVRSIPFNTAVWPALQQKKAFGEFCAAIDRISPLENARPESKTPGKETAPQLAHNIKLLQEKFIGRENDLKALEELVLDQNRMITVMGPGGIGKTRLVVEFCTRQLQNFDQRVWFVDLAETGNELDILTSLAHVFDDAGTSDKIPDFKALVRRIKALGRCLIVLDNFEQIRQYAVFLWNQLCENTPEATYLVTSRNTLGLDGEQILQLGALEYEQEAISLFEEHARSRMRSFRLSKKNRPVVREIIELVEGFPLLIKLAAARINLFSTEAIRDKLRNNLNLLDATAKTTEDSFSYRIVGWSWDLLSDKAKDTLAQLSVFEGPFDLEASVAALDGTSDENELIRLVHTLIDNSLLLSLRNHDKPTFRLHRIIKEYAYTKLSEMDKALREALMLRHARYFGQLASIETILEISAGKGDQSYRNLRAQLDNFEAAYKNTIELGDFATSYQNYNILQAILMKDGPFIKLHQLTELLYNNPGFTAKKFPAEWPRVAHWMGSTKRLIGDFKGARTVFEKLIREVDDDDHKQVRISKKALAIALWNMGETDKAIELYESIIEKYAKTDPAIVGAVYRDLAIMYWFQGKGPKALEWAEKGLLFNRKIDNLRYVMIAYMDLGMMYVDLSEDESDISYLDRCLEMAKNDAKDKAIEAIAMMYKSVAVHKRGDFEAAEQHFIRCLEHCKSINYRNMLTQTYMHYAFMLFRMGKNAQAMEICDAGLQTLQHYDNRWQEGLLYGIKGALMARDGLKLEAAEYIQQAEKLLDSIDENPTSKALIKLFGLVVLQSKQAGADKIQAGVAEVDSLISNSGFAANALIIQFRNSFAEV